MFWDTFHFSLSSLRSKAGKVKGWLKSRIVETSSWLEYQGVLGSQRGNSIRHLWDAAAGDIHSQWGRGQWDFSLLTGIIQRYQVHSVLDLGCGSGRLFTLYQELGLKDVVGIDISKEALALANRDFPRIETICCRSEDMEFPDGRFDLTISNRVLQHIPPYSIESVIENICRICRLVYVNELIGEDQHNETFFMRKYDYGKLFALYGFEVLESGSVNDQCWYLFGCGNSIFGKHKK